MADTLDLKILDELKLNSRASFAEIGRKVGLSPSSARERVQRMEISGLIKKYSLELDYTHLGNSIEAFMLLKIFHGKLKQFLTIVPNYTEIQECHRILGSDNIHMRLVLKDQLHLQRFIDSIMEYGHTTTHLILSDITSGKTKSIK